MSDRLGDREEAVNVGIERIRKKSFCNLVRGDTVIRDERDHLTLPVVDRADVAVKYLFEIGDRFAVAAIGERR